MTIESLNHLRVVIHINDGEEDYYDRLHYKDNYSWENAKSTCGAGQKRNIAGKMMIPTSPPIRTLHSLNDESIGDNMKAELLLIDDKTLQLNLLSNDDEGPYTNISNKMQFDHVSYATIDMMKLELAIIMDEMLLKRNNTGIMRFSTKFGTHINVFFDLFVTFINKRIYHQKYKLEYVKLECLEIGPCWDGSQYHPQEKGFSLRANLAGLGNSEQNGENRASVGTSRNIQNEFENTRDLLLWLLNEYRKKFDKSNRHEKMLFTFSIVDHQQNVFKVKLTLFNIFLELMNNVERNHWHHYMDHMGDGCQGHDCDFVHSGLTISLSSHFEGIASKKTILLFDVPTDIYAVADTVEMLQMAHTVVINRKKKESTTLRKKSNLDRRISLSSGDCSKCASPMAAQELNDLSPNVNYKRGRRSSLPFLMDKNSKGVSFSIPYNKKGAAVIRSPVTDNSYYFPKDFNTLSSWYRKIDEYFDKICSMREKYFSRYFELHFTEISSSIHNMFNALDSCYFQKTDDNTKKLRNHMEINELFERYHRVHKLFLHLSADIRDSEYEDLLQIYLETKAFDLNNHYVKLKRKHLDLSQQHLSYTFHSISNNLNSKFDL